MRIRTGSECARLRSPDPLPSPVARAGMSQDGNARYGTITVSDNSSRERPQPPCGAKASAS